VDISVFRDASKVDSEKAAADAWERFTGEV
jgi:hypothetical protein